MRVLARWVVINGFNQSGSNRIEWQRRWWWWWWWSLCRVCTNVNDFQSEVEVHVRAVVGVCTCRNKRDGAKQLGGPQPTSQRSNSIRSSITFNIDITIITIITSTDVPRTGLQQCLPPHLSRPTTWKGHCEDVHRSFRIWYSCHAARCITTTRADCVQLYTDRGIKFVSPARCPT